MTRDHFTMSTGGYAECACGYRVWASTTKEAERLLVLRHQNEQSREEPKDVA